MNHLKGKKIDRQTDGQADRHLEQLTDWLCCQLMSCVQQIGSTAHPTGTGKQVNVQVYIYIATYTYIHTYMLSYTFTNKDICT